MVELQWSHRSAAVETRVQNFDRHGSIDMLPSMEPPQCSGGDTKSDLLRVCTRGCLELDIGYQNRTSVNFLRNNVCIFLIW